jgi:hypothetical protein
VTYSTESLTLSIELWEDQRERFLFAVLDVPPQGIGAKIGHLDTGVCVAFEEEWSFDDSIHTPAMRGGLLKSPQHCGDTVSLMGVMIDDQKTPEAVLIEESLEAPHDTGEGFLNEINRRGQMPFVESLPKESYASWILSNDLQRLVIETAAFRTGQVDVRFRKAKLLLILVSALA